MIIETNSESAPRQIRHEWVVWHINDKEHEVRFDGHKEALAYYCKQINKGNYVQLVSHAY